MTCEEAAKAKSDLLHVPIYAKPRPSDGAFLCALRYRPHSLIRPDSIPVRSSSNPRLRKAAGSRFPGFPSLHDEQGHAPGQVDRELCVPGSGTGRALSLPVGVA